MDKDCCKNCKTLDYYDGYFCGLEKDTRLNEGGFIIDDIENSKCDFFTRRKDKFWSYEGAEF